MDSMMLKETMKETYEKVQIHQLINFDIIPEKDIKVSIIIPVYNVEQYLRECLDSAVNQTLQEIEIICVNDGSTDGSLEILKEYADHDSRVKVIDKENAGYGHTMNLGMDMACGECIGIIESDDYVDLQMYENLYEVISREKLDFVKSDFYRFHGEGESLCCKYNNIAREEKNYNRVINPKLEKESFKFIMNTWSGLYYTDFIRKNGIRHNETPGASFQDNGFWFMTNVLAEKSWYVDKAFYMNRRDNPNSSVYNTQKVYCVNKEYSLIYEFLEKNELKEDFLDVYNYKKYHSYFFTLRRIAPEFRKEYLKVFAEEFNDANKKGELYSKYLSPNDWNNLYWIMRDYNEYYYTQSLCEIKVSVILPVFNVGNYLEQCLKSILEQSLKEIEIICVDDGSTDNSLDILTAYQREDRRIKIIRQENKGAGAARNVGLSIAQGQFISFLDADDYIHKDMLKLAFDRATATNADICIYKSYFYNNETGELSECKFGVKEKNLPQQEVFSRTQISTNLFVSFMGWAWDKLYRRSFVLNQGLQFQEQRTTNDMFFVYASLLKAGRITVLDKRLYYQRRNVKTSLSNTRELSWKCFYFALLKIKAELQKMGIYEEYKQDFINYALHSCLWNFNSLREPYAEQLFHKLRQEWFSELEISNYDEMYFTNKEEYDEYREIVRIPLEDSKAYHSYQINYWKNKYESKEVRMDMQVKISDKETLTVGQMKEKLLWNRAKRLEMEKHIRNGGDSEYCLNEIRNSISYKIAMMITLIPRKMRQLVKGNEEKRVELEIMNEEKF